MKKLRTKIVVGVFLSATVVFMLTIFFFWLSTQINMDNRADYMTELILKYDGILPQFNDYKKMDDDTRIQIYSYDEESPYRQRYFVVKIEGNNAYSADISHIASVNENDAIKMSQIVMNENNETGYLNKFRFRYSKDSDLVIFFDCSDDIFSQRRLIVIISLIAFAFVIMITIVFYFLSSIIVKPFEENSKMQKRFITDASHELKTPLAIISANAEVLAYKDGENEWITNITTQVTRISELVNELLTLNRLEEVEEITDVRPVNIGEITEKTANDFSEVFKGKNVTMKCDIQSDAVINGNPAQLERLVSVLIENASKYAVENGIVEIRLHKGSRYTFFNVFNTCETDQNADFKHLFDRFYRPDTSRASETGGHGIGLSIAKRIVTLHGGTIEAVPKENGLSFNVRLSNKLKQINPRKEKNDKDPA